MTDHPRAPALPLQVAEPPPLPGAMLERDGNFPSDADTNRELDAIRGALEGHDAVA